MSQGDFLRLISLAKSRNWNELVAELVGIGDAADIIKTKDLNNDTIINELIKYCPIAEFFPILYLPNLSPLYEKQTIIDLLDNISQTPQKVESSWKILLILERGLQQQTYTLPVRVHARFSFLKAKGIIPFPDTIYDFLCTCTEVLSKEELFSWLQNTNPFPTSLEDLTTIFPSNSPLVIQKVNDLHISIDTPPTEYNNSEFKVNLTSVSVYPVGKQKLGVIFTKVKGGKKFYPMAWCTLRVEIPTSVGKIEPRDHAYFHISFAQLGYIE